jgi:Mg-chelatase subunit ChlD
MTAAPTDTERLRRWRLVLGGGDDGTGADLSGDDAGMDAVLAALYDGGPDGGSRGGGRRQAGLGRSSPQVARWLGDIRRYFPTSVVQVMQRDAIERLDLTRLLLEPEMLSALEPDIHLVGTLLALQAYLPDEARATARRVVATVVAEVEARLARPLQQATAGALRRHLRTRRPRPGDVDWNRTIQANLRHWLPDRRVLVPEHLVGFGRLAPAVQRELVIAIDQSGSMAESAVYAGVMGAALASVPALRTSVVAFSTDVVDLTGLLHDPVDVLFGIQLGGGTDINRAVAYCEGLITRPADTVLVIVSDLYEGGLAGELETRLAALTRAGVTAVVLLALSDEGAPSHDHGRASVLAALGVPCFACTPDAFPDLLAAAIERRDLGRWAGEHGFVSSSASPP